MVREICDISIRQRQLLPNDNIATYCMISEIKVGILTLIYRYDQNEWVELSVWKQLWTCLHESRVKLNKVKNQMSSNLKQDSWRQLTMQDRCQRIMAWCFALRVLAKKTKKTRLQLASLCASHSYKERNTRKISI